MSIASKSTSYFSGFYPFFVSGSASVINWFDAGNTQLLTLSGTNVTQWTSILSSNIYFTPLSNSPTYSSVDKSINFTTNQGLQGINTSTLADERQNETGFIVIKFNNVTSSNTIIGSASGTTNARIIQRSGTNIQLVRSGTPNTLVCDVSAGIVANTMYLIDWSRLQSGTGIYNFYVNGALLLSSNNSTVFNGNSTGSLGLTLGNTTPALEGSIYEFIYLPDFAIPDSNRFKVQKYLMEKWGLSTSIPVSHPFKVAYPYYREYSPLDEDIQPEYWFDASDLTTITASGTSLTTWSNKGSRVGSNITVVLGTARTGTTTQNGMNLISLSNGTRLQFSGTFPNQPRARFIATRTTVDPGVSNIEYYRRGTATTGGQDLLRSEPDGTGSGRISEQAQGVATNIQASGGLPVPPLNTFGIISCYNASASASNSVLRTTLTSISLLISSNAGNYSTATASNFINYNGGQDLGEWLSYNTDLSTGQQLRVGRYLFWKWVAGSTTSGNRVTSSGTRSFPTLYPVFNPRTEMSNCSIWIDAADPSTVTLTNGFVTSIRNKGTGQSSLTGGNGFTYNQTKFNGIYPSFYNSNTTGTSLLCSGSPALNQPFTFFIVGSRDNQTGTTSNYLVDGTSTTRASVLGVPAGTLRMGTDVCLNLTSVTLTNGFIGTFQFNTTTSIAYLNGTSNIAGSAGTGSTSNIRIGNSTSSNEPWNGHICEAIMYTVASSLPQIQRVEGYLAHKWGLVARLPSTHPYRKFRP